LEPKLLSGRPLLYWLLSDGFLKQVDSSTYGVKMPRASWDYIGSLPVTRAPNAEQSRVAAFLDRETAKIDTLIAKQERLIELLHEKRQALISHGVTKGLNPDAPMKPSGIEWLGDVPAHWDVRPLGAVCSYVSYGFTNPMPPADEGPYLVTANDIGDGVVLFESARRTTEDAYRRLLTRKSRPRLGDILITKDGTLGRIAVSDGTEFCINQSVALVCIDPNKGLNQFIALALQVDPYRERMLLDAGGTTIKHIYISRLTKMGIALPPRSEQEEIAERVDDLSRVYRHAIAKAKESISLMRERRTALISAAVTGKIDVRELREAVNA
jgi:type I restriction enzyme S subunit